MKITHSCGHVVEYKGVKDKKAMAARICPACDFAADRAKPKAVPHTVYCVERPLGPNTKPVIIIPKGAGPECVVREKSSEYANPKYDLIFATKAEAVAEVVRQVESGYLTLHENHLDREQAEAQHRSMLAMQAIDNREGRELTDRAMLRERDANWVDPDSEDADEALFGTH